MSSSLLVLASTLVPPPPPLPPELLLLVASQFPLFGYPLSPCLTKQNPSFLPSLPLQIPWTLKHRGGRPEPTSETKLGRGGGASWEKVEFPARPLALLLAQWEHHRIVSCPDPSPRLQSHTDSCSLTSLPQGPLVHQWTLNLPLTSPSPFSLCCISLFLMAGRS